MKTATANLENDHVHILRLIEVMEVITQQPEPNVEHLETIVGLIRNFADGLHHKKEEDLLFPKLVEKGFSFEAGSVAVMMQDHVEGRKFVKGIADNILAYKEGSRQAIGEIYRNMFGYIELLRAHINKENHVLFRMADNVLMEEEQNVLLGEFTKLERCPDEEGSVAGYLKQIELLGKNYNIPDNN